MLKENLLNVKNSLPANVKLVAVSKFKPLEDLMDAYNAGQRAFGENRPQEMFEKQQNMPDDVEWHFIGSLQSNKVKLVVPKTFLIHSIDSRSLLVNVNKEAEKLNKIMDCLLEFHIAVEESKHGFSIDDAVEFLKSDEFKSLKNVRIRGVMGMASFVDDENVVRQEFRRLKDYFDLIKTEFFADADYFTEISMGMSGDYKIAVEEGSTIVRVGSLIFGAR